MAKQNKHTNTKKKKKEQPLKIHGTLEQVLKVAVTGNKPKRKTKNLTIGSH